MAKYIAKDMVEERMLEYAIISRLNYHQMSTFILNIPPANVIERSKINKAIEEIEKTENTQEHIFYDGDIGTRGAFNDGMEKALDILKRNIGE